MVRDQCDQIGRYFGFWATDVRKYDRNSMDLLGKTLKPSAASPVNGYTTVNYDQCDQIWRFIGLWATF